MLKTNFSSVSINNTAIKYKYDNKSLPSFKANLQPAKILSDIELNSLVKGYFEQNPKPEIGKISKIIFKTLISPLKQKTLLDKPFYHGDKLSIEHLKDKGFQINPVSEKLNEAGNAIYFTPSKILASNYGNNVVEAKLDFNGMKIGYVKKGANSILHGLVNAVNMDKIIEFCSKSKIEDSQSEKLIFSINNEKISKIFQHLGFDGVYYETMGGGGRYITPQLAIFDPKKIKAELK